MTTRKAENHYPTMPLEDIKALPVPDLAAPDSMLFLWATPPKLAEACEVMAAWGFEFISSAAWVKGAPGIGHYFRQSHEALLLGRRGKLPVPHEGARAESVIEAPRGDHSAKPECVYEVIEAMYPGHARIDLFARAKRAGWTAWGIQAPR